LNRLNGAHDKLQWGGAKKNRQISEEAKEMMLLQHVLYQPFIKFALNAHENYRHDREKSIRAKRRPTPLYCPHLPQRGHDSKMSPLVLRFNPILPFVEFHLSRKTGTISCLTKPSPIFFKRSKPLANLNAFPPA
jgi:hypothetical protein